MSGFKEFDRFDGLGLAELVRKKEVSSFRTLRGSHPPHRAGQPQSECRHFPDVRHRAVRPSRQGFLKAVYRGAVPSQRHHRGICRRSFDHGQQGFQELCSGPGH